MAFPTVVELAFKRTKLKRVPAFRDPLALFRVVGDVFGCVKINFDAEGPQERPSFGELEELCTSGMFFSETYQAGFPDYGRRYLRQLAEHFQHKHNFGLNFVLGNPRYGCTPALESLEEGVSFLETYFGHSGHGRVKVGVEGGRFGSKILRLCAKYGSAAYILKTPWMFDLVDSARLLGVKAAVYTPIRLSDDRGRALREMFEVMGLEYFARRGISQNEVAVRAGDYVVYGSPTDVAAMFEYWKRSGVEVFVLSPVFSDEEDLRRQLKWIKLTAER